MENAKKSEELNHMPAENKQISEVEDAIDLYGLFMKILDQWRQVALSAFAFALIFLLYTVMFITPTYEATAKIYVVSKKNAAINLSDLQLSNYLTNDYVEVFKTWHVHETVLSRLNLNYSYGQVRNMITVTNPADTRILYIKATSTDPAEARDLANTYADVAREFIALKMDVAEPTLFEEALKPTAPSAPSKTKNTMMGFLLGAFLAVAIITLRFILDDYIRTSDDVSKYLGLPTLGMVMLQPDEDKKPKGKSGSKSGRRN